MTSRSLVFNSFQFWIFFVAAYFAHAVVPRSRRVGVLVGASLVFYALWVPSAVIGLAVCIVVNYGLLVAMTRSSRPKRFLVASVVLTLGMLAFFKYAAFVLSLLLPFSRSLGPLEAQAAWWVVPLGVSFYSFEMVSVAVDVYERKIERPLFLEYALLVTFFPHLVSGPILRGGELLPQFRAGGEKTRARTRRGLWLFVVGLAKKTILSDFLLRPAVTEAFQFPGVPGGPVHLIGLYSFAFQIYFDFSGYTDMARGLACLLGFELPTNFEEPYLSRTPNEFWRRWHQTLSRWLRDYLYIPLGGSRRGPTRTLVNLMLTMMLGGLWHGAGVNFLLWGTLHGALLVAYRLARRAEARDTDPLVWSDAARVVVCFHLVCLCWVPFRAATWRDTVAFYGGLFSRGYLGPWPILALSIVALCAALHVAERAARARLPEIHARVDGAFWGPVFEGTFLGVLVTASILASGAGVQFIYFQF